MASKESGLIKKGGSTYSGRTGLVLGKNLSKPFFKVLEPPPKEILTEAAKASGLKSGHKKVAYVFVAGKHVTCSEST